MWARHPAAPRRGCQWGAARRMAPLTLRTFLRAHPETAAIRGPCSSQPPKWTSTLAQLGASRGGGQDGEAC